MRTRFQTLVLRKYRCHPHPSYSGRNLYLFSSKLTTTTWPYHAQSWTWMNSAPHSSEWPRALCTSPPPQGQTDNPEIVSLLLGLKQLQLINTFTDPELILMLIKLLPKGQTPWQTQHPYQHVVSMPLYHLYGLSLEHVLLCVIVGYVMLICTGVRLEGGGRGPRKAMLCMLALLSTLMDGP